MRLCNRDCRAVSRVRCYVCASACRERGQGGRRQYMGQGKDRNPNGRYNHRFRNANHA